MAITNRWVYLYTFCELKSLGHRYNKEIKRKIKEKKLKTTVSKIGEKKLVKSPITVKQLHVQEKKETSLFIQLPRHVEEID
jgi:hypothetical protein